MAIGLLSWGCLNIKMLSYEYRDPMLKITRSHDCLIFNMGIPIPGKVCLYIETEPWYVSIQQCMASYHVQSVWFVSEVNTTCNYRKISNIRRTESPNLNVSCLVVQLPLPNPMRPGVQSRMKMWLEQRRQAMLQLHLSDWQVYCPLPYIRRDLTVPERG